MWFTREEIRDIANGDKRLTIRQKKANGHLPIKVGSKTYIKTGSLVSKERYGRIIINGLEIKPLGAMNLKDAMLGGYSSSEAYIKAQLEEFNSNCDLDTPMLFYTFEVLDIDWDLVNTL